MQTSGAKKIQRAKILVVDDKDQMRDVLRKFLAAEGYAVETAADGRDALRKFAGDEFELVLSAATAGPAEGSATGPGACPCRPLG